MSVNHPGRRIPEVVIHARKGHEWVSINSREYFANKTVIVFSLPGAFTPTCSSAHVPRYNQLAPIFFRHGVDEIICISVNDAFVMNEWKEAQKADRITFLPDGNGEFTQGMGMLEDRNELGFGKRSWRYSMLVRDGVVEKMFVEPKVPGDPFEVSDADTMLAYLAPNAETVADVTVFTRKGCPHCSRAKQLLADAGMEYEELVLNRDYTDRTLRAVSGADSYPQIYINAQHIGGADELAAWLRHRKTA